ncbi:hypothetical protein RND71_012239 [Anisodus tanguticus]|uniref:Uncharacterized protein n=1 Tax=Anisodus tanguticus TaxID=243964 RepID=A0AAE1SFD3_9SOLA|nr:hypothetical protein RND71_012239 [Anisodus tanguticus]
MGEEDSQKLKSIAASAYDYENDPRWADYWSNILIPPPMASRNDVVHHFKRKFYQRYIDPGLVVEPMTTSSSSQSARPSAAQPHHHHHRRPQLLVTSQDNVTLDKLIELQARRQPQLLIRHHFDGTNKLYNFQ